MFPSRVCRRVLIHWAGLALFWVRAMSEAAKYITAKCSFLFNYAKPNKSIHELNYWELFDSEFNWLTT